MGEQIADEHFSEDDRAAFRRRLDDSLDGLAALLRRPGFGRRATTVGAELEMFLVADGSPAPINEAVREAAADGRVALEVGRFNLEVNLTPREVAGRPFTAVRAETREVLGLVSEASRRFGAAPVLIGILPTLRREHLDRGSITRAPRYHVLDRELVRRRTSPFRITIDGPDHCAIDADSIAVQAACCSWQVHLVVPPDEFTATYNAAQLATGPVLAAAGNSPLLLGSRLWQETRIALYEQGMGDHAAGATPRVSFGADWLRDGAIEVFADLVRTHDSIIPVLSEEDPVAAVRAGRTPRLSELRLHQSTVWSWNRPVYDPTGDGHLRVELRSLPSGPTPLDMAANTAFLLGLTAHLVRAGGGRTAGFPFAAARQNFYQAAATGLAARLRWPGEDGPCPAADLARRLLPSAADGLSALGVERDEADGLLSVVAERIATGRTGAHWQQRAFEALRERSPAPRALRDLVRRYTALSALDQPVHTWPIPC
ncbi:glutamate--cysteine ligase [Actinosynnema sp. CS-041913]|uniref:glutamate--cysteine ligase n=1 Tax=Actinosynnema sp. CS-041913 TaxID=3239917 RepID=UPI003D8CE369